MSELKGDNKAIQQFHPFNLYGYDEANPFPIMTAKQKEAMLEMYNLIVPKIKDEFKKQIIICGTGGDFESTENLKDIFYNVHSK